MKNHWAAISRGRGVLNGGGRGNASRAMGITSVAGGGGGVLGSSGDIVVAGAPGARAEVGGGMPTATAGNMPTATVGANALNGSAWLSMGGAPVGSAGVPGGGDSGVAGGAGGGGGSSVGGGGVAGGNVDGGGAVVGVSGDGMGEAAGGAPVQNGGVGQEATNRAQGGAQGLGLERTMEQSAADKEALELAAAVMRGGRAASGEIPTPIPEQAYHGHHHHHQHEHHHQQPHHHETHHYPPDPHHHGQHHDGTVIHHQHHQVDGQREVTAGEAVVFGAADGGLVRGSTQRKKGFS